MRTLPINLHAHKSLRLFRPTELIASWNNLLNWSENAAVARRLQEDIIAEKHLLDSIVIENVESLDTEQAIRDKIQELIVSKKVLIDSPNVSLEPLSKLGKPEISLLVTHSFFNLFLECPRRPAQAPFEYAEAECLGARLVDATGNAAKCGIER